jgi:prepilin-type processing-associated H-X9-DG protein/prepilin-type N-terminal cleavage/methylation domain-containing protein
MQFPRTTFASKNGCFKSGESQGYGKNFRSGIHPRSSLYPKSWSSSFTLVELLVVVAILGLLAGLLVPSLGKAREASQNAVCLANLKQWGYVIEAYARDNNGTLPYAGTSSWYLALWQVYLFPNKKFPTNYAGSAVGIFPKEMEGTIYECPRMKKTDPPTKAYRSYGMNYHAGNTNTGRLLSVPNPSLAALMGEAWGGSAITPSALIARHGSNCNILYADGHVAPVVLTQAITNGWTNAFWGTN